MLLKRDPINLIIAGVGGQGNILASQLIGNALVAKNYFVTIGETYGAAQRGGAVMSHLRISRKIQYSPLIAEGKSDFVLGLEPIEAVRVLGTYGNPDVITVVNSRPIYPLDVMIGNSKYPSLEVIRSILTELSHEVYILDASAVALSLGNPILTNIVMVGALLALNTLPLTEDDLKSVLKKTFPDQKLEVNLRALQMGMEALQKA